MALEAFNFNLFLHRRQHDPRTSANTFENFPAELTKQICRDADDDDVLACALAADFAIAGDDAAMRRNGNWHTPTLRRNDPPQLHEDGRMTGAAGVDSLANRRVMPRMFRLQLVMRLAPRFWERRLAPQPTVYTGDYLQLLGKS